MNRGRRFAAGLAGSLVMACVLLPVVAAGAGDEPAQQSDSWWSRWSWGEGVLRWGFGGVSYGDSASRITGSDNLVNQLRTISGVKGIELSGPIDVVLKQGPAEKLALHTDDNIAPLIQTAVDDGILRIGVQPGAAFRTKHAIGVTVELPHLDSVKVLGSGDLSCSQFDTDLLEIATGGSGRVRFDSLRTGKLAVRVQGSGDVRLSGTAAKQAYGIEGSGNIDAEELAGREVAVRIAGSGGAKVWATESLSIEIAGSGNVDYRGQPVLTRNVHGPGDVVHH